MKGWVWMVVAALAAPNIASAQVAPAEVARRLVGEGIEAARSRDWIGARAKFQQAYKIQPLPLTLYNLATAQEKSGQLVEADRSYRVFLRETSAGEHPEFRKAAASRRTKLRQRIAYVVVDVENLAPDDVLKLGGQELAHAVLGESVPMNPGALDVVILRKEVAIATRTVSLPEGGSQRVAIRLDPPPPPVAVLPDLPKASAAGAGPAVTATSPALEEDEGGGLLSSPLFWGIVAGVVVVGGAAAYVVTRPADPFESSLTAVTIRGR